jgi:Uma2 family endonuclease
MSAVAKPEPVSIEEYLEGERLSEVRHEYVAGRVREISNNTADHNRIVGNILVEIRAALRSQLCEPFALGMLLRIPELNAFFYPDVMVACDPKDNEKYFRERPVIIFEVLSPDTERTDRREKALAYGYIESLRVYVLIEQGEMRLTVLRPAADGSWTTQIVEGRDATLALPEIDVRIPFDRIYERTTLLRPTPGG